MKKISVYGKRHQEDYLPLLSRFFVSLVKRGFDVSVAAPFALYLKESGVCLPASLHEVTELPECTECVVSVGGDGTFLRAAQWVGKREIPILGINTGHLGFLASYSLEEMDELMEVISDNAATFERRMVLQVNCESMPEGFWPYALNEVALMRGETASMVTVHTEVNGNFLADYMADGLVVATPTGSTAYNLSVGGPIMEPTLECTVLSPIAPHSLTMRPLVINGDSVVGLRAESRVDHSRVSLDGRYFNIPSDGTMLEISKADFAVVVMRRPNSRFARLLRNKLLWGRGNF
ncbi:MAG: NAD(+)/NADH kinase [Muribaculaceae bacterium]|nr:NAD(+)/NADH kinase [Muribaculaceae bacterium]